MATRVDTNLKPKLGKTSKSRSDTCVQGTNDNSIVSKWSSSELGYFRDEFLEWFIAKPCRRSPLINRCYYIRSVVINQVLTRFLAHHRSTPVQILSLGAGFDSTFFRLKSRGLLGNAVYVELDFPELLERKLRCIHQSPQLCSLLGATVSSDCARVVFNSADYKLAGIDLTQLELVGQVLDTLAVSVSIPTLILSEVVLTYLSPDCSSRIIGWAADTFENAVFVTYEQVLPTDAFGLFMCDHFRKLGSPLRCIEHFPSVVSQVERYLHLGWAQAVACDMNHFDLGLLPRPEHCRVDGLEPFDEFEEWTLASSHYILLTAFIRHDDMLAGAIWAPLATTTTICDSDELDKNNKSVVADSNVTTSAAGVNEEMNGESKSILVECESEELVAQKGLKCGRVSERCETCRIVEGDRDGCFVQGFRSSSCDALQTTKSLGCHSNWGQVEGGSSQTQLSAIECNVELEGSKQYDSTLRAFEAQVFPPEQRTIGHVSEIYKEQFLRTGHTLSRVCLSGSREFLVLIGGFGPVRCKHQRLKHITAIEITSPSKQSDVNQTCDVKRSARNVVGVCDLRAEDDRAGFSSLVHERMFHTASVIDSGRVLLFGGRTSPLRAFSDVTLLELSATPGSSAPRAEPVGRETGPEEDVGTVGDGVEVEVSEANIASLQTVDSVWTPANSIPPLNESERNSSANAFQRMTPGLVEQLTRRESSAHTAAAVSKPCIYPRAQSIYATLRVIPTVGVEPCARWRHTATFVRRGGCALSRDLEDGGTRGGRLVVFGGRWAGRGGESGGVGCLGDCWTLNCETWRWTQAPSRVEGAPSPRHSHSADLWREDMIVVFGGLDDDLRPLGSAHILDLGSASWREFVPTSRVLARYSHTSGVHGDRLIVVGGVSLTPLAPAVTVIDLVTGAARDYHIRNELPSQPIVMLHNHASARLYDNDEGRGEGQGEEQGEGPVGVEFVIVGGGGNCFSFGTHLNPCIMTLNVPSVDNDLI